MLFMAITDAAALAAATAAGVSFSAARASNADITDERLSLTSLAKSGIWPFSSSIDIAALRHLQRVAADLAVARAQLIGLEGVEHAQRVLRRATDIEVGGVDVLDRVVGIDDVGIAIGDALGRAHAETVDQRTRGVGE